MIAGNNLTQTPMPKGDGLLYIGMCLKLIRNHPAYSCFGRLSTSIPSCWHFL